VQARVRVTRFYTKMSSAASRLAELAASLASHIFVVEQHLKSNNLPPLSFGTDTLVDLQFPEKVQLAREAALDEATEIKELLLGPRATIVDYQVRKIYVYINSES
jgi:hypothetical protein